MIPFVGPSHPLGLDRVDLQRSVNLYPVRAEDAGEKSERHLAPAPGLTVWSAGGDASLAAFFSVSDASSAVIDGAELTVYVTRSGKTDSAVSVGWAITGDVFNGDEGFEADAYSGVLHFAPGETVKPLTFTLQVAAGTEFDAVVTLSVPSAGAFIEDGTGTLTASGAADPNWENVIYLHRYDNLAAPLVQVDEQGRTWERFDDDAALRNDADESPNPKWAPGSLYGFNEGLVPFLRYDFDPTPALDAGGLNRFTIDGWMSTSQFGIAGWGFESQSAYIRVEKQGTGLHLRGSFSTGAFDLSGVIANDVYTFVEANYDGTHLRLFIGGVMVDKEAIAPGDALTIASGRVGGTSMSPGDGFWFDESRFTAGVCRHPSDSTYAVPTGPFPGGVA